MDIIANISLNIYSFSILTKLTICVFVMTEHCLFLYDTVNAKNHICNSVNDHSDNSSIQKIRNQETFSTEMDKISC